MPILLAAFFVVADVQILGLTQSALAVGAPVAASMGALEIVLARRRRRRYGGASSSEV